MTIRFVKTIIGILISFTKYYLVNEAWYIPLLAIMRGQPKSEFDLCVIENVKKMRTAHKISQAVLAIKLEVSDAFIGQIENPKNRSKYSLEQINLLAKIFNCSPKDFLPEEPI
uniref:helix-turn-helix domain-containing protein n=1 Tax=Pedobacter schmidteae TaxID=2201271 RepID=UPI001D01AC92|nr:helix-turn-helix transcriptional regulator [Pedobacter schmidteae]